MELSIDTSTAFCAIAISQKGVTIKELSWDSKRNHSVELAPAIWSIMREINIDPSDLETVFLAKGPGGFSSLRVGMSFAKAISLSLGIPLVSIGTLDVEIKPYLPSKIPVYAMIKAASKSVYSINNLDPKATVRVIDLEDIVNMTVSPTVFCGEAMIEIESDLIQNLGDLAIVKNKKGPTRSASTLASLAYEKLITCGGDNIDQLEPIYISGAQFESAQRHSLNINPIKRIENKERKHNE